MTSFEKLDRVLSLLSETNDAQIGNNIEIAKLDLSEIINFLENDKKNPSIFTRHEMGLILAKLTKDEYVYFIPHINVLGLENNTDRWQISFEGDVFIKQGGYTKKFFEENQAKTLASSQPILASRLNWLTFLIAVGTLVAAVYYIQQIWLTFHMQPCH